MDDSLATKLRQTREYRGLSLSELARRSGIGKGTVSELENGLRGARLDTLFALSTALQVPLGALLPNSADELPTAISGTSVTATLIGKWASSAGTIETYRTTVSTRRQHSDAHHLGVEETITVISGRVQAGVEGHERELGPGESIRYRGDKPHAFAAVGSDAEAILIMHYPHSVNQKGAHHDQ